MRSQPSGNSGAHASRAPLPPVDHLVWGGLSLEQEIQRLESWTGIRAAPSGRHPGEGTRNALMRVGDGMYLELIGPDPTQPPPPRARWLGLDALSGPRLITWAAKCPDLDQRASAARAAGVEVGELRRGERELNGGQVLSWRLTYPNLRLGDGLVPFLIDWGQSRHPADTAPGGVQLLDLRAEHPDPAAVLGALRHLGLELRVEAGPAPALIATLETPRGRVELR
jgi:hypothetical protein